MGPEDAKFLTAGIRFIAESKDIKKTIHELVRLAASAAGTEMGSLYVLENGKGVLRPFAVVGLPESYLQGCGEIAVGAQCCGRAVLHRRPWIVEDMLTDPLFAEGRQAAIDSGIRSGFSVPVLNQNGDAIGALGSQFSYPFKPSAHAIERNQLFASLIAYALARHADESEAPGSTPASLSAS